MEYIEMEIWQEFLRINPDNIEAINKFIEEAYQDLITAPMLLLREGISISIKLNYIKDPLYDNKESFKQEQEILKKILEKISKGQKLSKRDIEKIDSELQKTVLITPRYYFTEETNFTANTILGYIYYQVYQLLIKPDLRNKELRSCEKCKSFYIPKRENQKYCSSKCRKLAYYYRKAKEIF